MHPNKTLGKSAKRMYFAHMKPQASAFNDDFEDPPTGVEEAERRTEDDLWLSRLVPDFN